jgi:TusA-related sulfurtransferase
MVTMSKIAVFTNKDSQICDFFDAECFLIFERGETEAKWKTISKSDFKKIIPSNPALTRKNTEALLPLIDGCDILAGGTLVGIPFSVFDRSRFHIFEIGAINDEIFDGIIEELRDADAAAAAKEKIIREAKPVETSTPGVYFLDLIALQKECPEVTSKKAMMDFLKDTPFLELQLVCKHIPPWIENNGAYNVQVTSDKDGTVQATITKKC